MDLSRSLLILVMASLTGCSAWENYLQEQEQQKRMQIATQERTTCNTGWEALASQSATIGYANQEAMDYYQTLCTKHDYRFDLAQWKKGYRQGEAIYCSNLQAYRLGKSQYQYVVEKCANKSAKQKNQLASAYQLGWNWAQSASQLDIYPQQIQRYDEWINTLEKASDKGNSHSSQRELRELKRERAEIVREQKAKENERIQLDNQNLSILMRMNP